MKGYAVKSVFIIKSLGITAPLFDIPVMDDLTWNRLAQESAIRGYMKAFGYKPVTIDEALEWQRRRAGVASI